MKNFKKFNRIIVCLIIVASIGLLTDCEKKNETVLEEFTNPMDFVGVVHNEGLAYIEENYTYFKNSKDLETGLFELTNDFVSNYSDNEFIYNPSIDYVNFGNIVFDYIKNNDVKNAIEYPFSEKEQSKDFYYELTTLISNSTYLDPPRLFNKVQELEEKIYYSTLPEEDKFLLLAICSIGKYSFQYWTGYIENSNYKNYSPYSKGGLREELANADIEGAIAGAIGGAIGGAIWGSVLLPGVGTITAAIVEAVHVGFYGAFIGSGVRLLRELL